MAGLSSVLGLNMLTGCSATSGIAGATVEGVLRDDGLFIPLKSFGDETKPRQYIVAHHKQLKFPICVYRISSEEFSALWLECTHQGAELQVFGQKMECPAHGSEFNMYGGVESGPASKNLRRFETAIVKDQLKITLK